MGAWRTVLVVAILVSVHVYADSEEDNSSREGEEGFNYDVLKSNRLNDEGGWNPGGYNDYFHWTHRTEAGMYVYMFCVFLQSSLLTDTQAYIDVS